jgi:hypothetical protein
MREGRPLPKRIAEAPELCLGLELYYTAFWALSTCRALTMSGPGYIPWQSMMDYARSLGLDEEQTDDLFHHVRSMDVAWVRWQHERAKRG